LPSEGGNRIPWAGFSQKGIFYTHVWVPTRETTKQDALVGALKDSGRGRVIFRLETKREVGPLVTDFHPLPRLSGTTLGTHSFAQLPRDDGPRGFELGHQKKKGGSKKDEKACRPRTDCLACAKRKPKVLGTGYEWLAADRWKFGYATHLIPPPTAKAFQKNNRRRPLRGLNLKKKFFSRSRIDQWL